MTLCKTERRFVGSRVDMARFLTRVPVKVPISRVKVFRAIRRQGPWHSEKPHIPARMLSETDGPIEIRRLSENEKQPTCA